MNTTRTRDESETLARRAVDGMSPLERSRLERYASSMDISVEQAVVLIVEQVLTAEGH